MNNHRDVKLQNFVDCLDAAFRLANLAPAAGNFVGELFAALQVPATKGETPACQLSVCSHLPAALNHLQTASPGLAPLATAFAGIAPELAWKVRPSGGPHASANWTFGHANAVIIGTGGIEERGDVAVGVSLLAPNVRYPDHTHPPEELYLLLTPGFFQHGEEDWCEPGAFSTFHNSPGIKHAMASGDVPLLAVWTMINR